MTLAGEIQKNSFAAGEVSKALYGRPELAKNQAGCKLLENMVVLIEGGVTRRPGTQMVQQLVSGRAYAGVPFRFSGSGSNAYLIVIGNGVAQFIVNNSVVVIGGGNNNPYTVAVPYTDADLGGAGAATPGVSNLRYAASGNVVFLFCDGYQTQTLTRNADNSWTLAPYITQPANPAPQGGCIAPPGTANLDQAETLGVSNNTGTITLSASAAFAGASATVPNGFQQGHVGSVWQINESTLSLVPEWTADQDITVSLSDITPSGTYIGNGTNESNCFDGNLATYGSFSNTAAAWVGEQLASPTSVAQVTISPPSPPPSPFHFTTFTGVQEQITFSLYGSNMAPTSATDGTLLGSVTIQNNPNDGGSTAPAVIISNNPVGLFSHLWIVGAPTSGAQRNWDIAEVAFQAVESGDSPVYGRYNGNVYQAINSGNTGTNPPEHTSGTVLSGVGGVGWRYLHRGYGFVQIESVQSSTAATALVLETLPLSVVQIPTANWSPSAWDGVQGWPDRGFVFQNSLWAAYKNKFWRTQPGSFDNWDIPDPTSAQSGIAGGLISPTGSLAWIEAFIGNSMFLGTLTRDEEWVMAGQDPFSALSVQILSPYPAGSEGSAQHIPALCQGGIITITRDRARALYQTIGFNGVVPSIAKEELTAASRHILGPAGGGALGVSHQQDPNRISWFFCANGLLVGNTLFREQQINGWHRHPASVPTIVNEAISIPSNDEGKSWTYFLTTRTIGGVQKQFVELLQPYFGQGTTQPENASDAWYLDCALSYSGAPTLTLGGLNHLVGQAVGVHADGCTYKNPDGSLPVVNAAGEITLSRPTQNAVVGLPIKYRVRTLGLAMEGLSTARSKANHLFLRVMNSAGGKVGVNVEYGGQVEDLEEPGVMTYGAPIPLRSGIIRTPGLEVPLADETVVDVCGDDTMPFTLLSVQPDVEVTEAPQQKAAQWTR